VAKKDCGGEKGRKIVGEMGNLFVVIAEESFFDHITPVVLLQVAVAIHHPRAFWIIAQV